MNTQSNPKGNKTQRYCRGCHTSHSYRADCLMECGCCNGQSHLKQKKKQHNQPKQKQTTPTSTRKRKHNLLTEITMSWQEDQPTSPKHNRKNSQNKNQKKTEKPTETSCPVCLEDKSLRLLGCGHGLCQGCYGEITQKEGSKCPLCRMALFRGEARNYGVRHNLRGTRRRQRSYRLVGMPTQREREEEEEALRELEEMEMESDEESELSDSDQDADQFHDEMLLSEACFVLKQWRKSGGDVISKAMEQLAFQYQGLTVQEANSGDRLPYQTQQLAQCLSVETTRSQLEIVCHLIDIYNEIYSLEPPEDIESWSAQVLGELKRVFGYATWVNRVDLDDLERQKCHFGWGFLETLDVSGFQSGPVPNLEMEPGEIFQFKAC